MFGHPEYHGYSACSSSVSIDFNESLQIITKHQNSNFWVRLRASAVDPEVMSETGETIVVSGYLGHIICKSKTIKRN